jgi:hypothetical protein
MRWTLPILARHKKLHRIIQPEEISIVVTGYAISSELLPYVWSDQNSRYKYKSSQAPYWLGLRNPLG